MRKLLIQIRNEWKRNVFLGVELLVVGCLLWYLVDWCYVTIRTYTLPVGFDVSHCYQIFLGKLTPQSPEFQAGATPEDDMSALEQIVERLRHRPGVEYAALSQNSIPYNSGSNSSALFVDSTAVRGRQLWAQPDFFRLFRFRGVAMAEEDGRAWQTTNIDCVALAVDRKRRHLLVSRNFVSPDNGNNLPGMEDATSMLGHWYPFNSNSVDSDFRFFVAGVTEPIRPNHFTSSSSWGGYYMGVELTHDDLVDLENPRYMELSIRVTPDADTGQRFMDELMADADRLYQVGNVFLLDVIPFDELRYFDELDSMNEVRTQCIIIGFLLLNIFLGVVGTFWFRTQHRRGEIALRIAFGSTRGGVFGRLIAEGLLILTVMLVPTLLIALNIGMSELVDVERMSFTATRFAIAIAFSWVLMALMIVAGIWYPARKAMNVQPAEVLHDE